MVAEDRDDRHGERGQPADTEHQPAQPTPRHLAIVGAGALIVIVVGRKADAEKHTGDPNRE